MVALGGDPEVARWQWLGDPQTPEQARAALEEKIAHWGYHGFGQWIWRQRESGEPVGRIGLQWTSSPGELVVEIGWSVIPAMQGRGFATEAAKASLRYGFEEAGCEEIVAFTWIENLASLRVMEKLKMQPRREFELEGLPHRLYAIGPADLPAQA